MKLGDYIRESNRIEGIVRDPAEWETEAHRRLLALDYLTVRSLEDFVFDICGKRLRREVGMNVRIGPHTPMPGGPAVEGELKLLLAQVNARDLSPYGAHVRYETLHPFLDGNGRSGRAVWAWMMQRLGRDPFELGFLHAFYYQALNASGPRT